MPSSIKVDLTGNFQNAIQRAAEIIISGGIVAYPTESFYGLAVDITNDKAIQRLFALKKRQPDSPVLILVSSIEMAEEYSEGISENCRRLMKEFWPGGLTLILKANTKISPLLTANTGKIGIRISSHPVATALPRYLGIPISSTSANISGNPACSKAADVMESFQKNLDMILDGGDTKGTGSTVLDVTIEPHLIVREGMVTADQLKNKGFECSWSV